MQPGSVAPVEGEHRPRQLGPALHVEDAQGLADLPVGDPLVLGTRFGLAAAIPGHDVGAPRCRSGPPPSGASSAGRFGRSTAAGPRTSAWADVASASRPTLLFAQGAALARQLGRPRLVAGAAAPRPPGATASFTRLAGTLVTAPDGSGRRRLRAGGPSRPGRRRAAERGLDGDPGRPWTSRMSIIGAKGQPVPLASRRGAGAPIYCRELVVRYGAGRRWTGSRSGPSVARCSPCWDRTAPARPRPSRALEGYRQPGGGQVRVLGLDPVTDHRRPRAAHRGHAPAGRRLPDDGPTPGARALRRLLRGSRGSRGAHRAGRTERAGADTVGGGFREASSSGCPWPWRWWAGPRWSSWTSRRPGSTPRAAWPIRAVIADLATGVCVRPAHHPRAARGRASGRRGGHHRRGRAVAAARSPSSQRPPQEAASTSPAPPGVDLDDLAVALGVEPKTILGDETGHYVVNEEATPARLGRLATWLAEHDLPLQDLHAGTTSLEDVYLEVTRAQVALDGEPEPRPGPQPSSIHSPNSNHSSSPSPR